MARYSMLAVVSVLAALASPAAHAQEAAGRILVAVGDVTIQRGSEKLRAERGAEVRTGDLFLLGEKSNMQMRLSDESIIALRSGTTFRLTEYAYQGKAPKEQRSLFDLVKGGMRTVTGLIARASRDNYAVKTPNATIGIRGTHYSLVECAQSCFGAGGAPAPDGTYGAVTDGRIGVTNQTGETVFGADQYFHVASAATPAQQLIAPPPFVRDVLEGRAAAKPAAEKPAAGGQGAAQASGSSGGESATTVALSGIGGGSGDVGVSASTSAGTNVPVLAINPFVVTDAAVAAGSTGQVVSVPGEGLLVYRTLGGTLTGTCTGGPPCSLIVAEIRIGVNLQKQLATAWINVIEVDPGYPGDQGAFNVASGLLSPGIPIVNNNGVLSFSGSLTTAEGASLRCEKCNNGGPGQLQAVSLSGTVTASGVNLTFTGTDPSGDSGTFNVLVPQVPLVTTPVAAVAFPGAVGSTPNQVTQSSGFDNAVDASGLVRFGWLAGGPQGDRGSATPVIVGSAPSAGNLVWGKWTGPGAQIVTGSYNSFTTGSGQRVDWIYGDPALVTAVSGLGTVTYSPVGYSLNNGNGVLNSASLTANFTTRDISLNVNATNPTAGNTFQWSGATQYGVTTTRFQGSLSGTCNGACGTGAPSSGAFAGFIAGSSGQGAGVALSAGTGTPGQGVSGVIGFQR